MKEAVEFLERRRQNLLLYRVEFRRYGKSKTVALHKGRERAPERQYEKNLIANKRTYEKPAHKKLEKKNSQEFERD